MKSLLLPFSWLFRAGVNLRNMAFDHAWLTTRELSCPVISVGNLTVGGTGKTPMVIYLAEKIQKMGFKPAILSRGYRRKGKGTIVVSDGRKPPLDYTVSGDEPILMAKRLPKIPIVVDEVRLRGGTHLVRKFDPDVIILDDGFQHRLLHRDIDIVLLDATSPFSGGMMLPAGRLREPPKSLYRADLVIFTRSTQETPTQKDLDLIKTKTDAPILKSIHQPMEWVSLDGKRKLPISEPIATNPLLVSGIVRPDHFESMVRSLGITPAAHLTYPDHHRYGTKELDQIAGLYRTLKADAILTTEKDLIKWPPLLKALKVWALRISMVITEGEEQLEGLSKNHIMKQSEAKKP